MWIWPHYCPQKVYISTYVNYIVWSSSSECDTVGKGCYLWLTCFIWIECAVIGHSHGKLDCALSSDPVCHGCSLSQTVHSNRWNKSIMYSKLCLQCHSGFIQLVPPSGELLLNITLCMIGHWPVVRKYHQSHFQLNEVDWGEMGQVIYEQLMMFGTTMVLVLHWFSEVRDELKWSK